MSNLGQAALTIAGFAVGSVLGFPQLGFIAGSLLGGALFPTKLPGASGPRLSDTRTTTAQMGGPVMEVFGTDAVPGNVMWMAPLREQTNSEEVGGKGAPSQKLTTYSYFQSIAVGICRGPMGGLLRVWENGTVVYDSRPRLDTESDDDYTKRAAAASTFAEGFELYLGDETQLPSPTIELEKGVGNTPAFRGLMYIVFPDRQLKEEQALRHPNWKFEVSQLVESETIYSTEVLDPWTSGDVDPRYMPGDALLGYSYRYYLGSGPLGSSFDTLEAALVDGNAATTPPGGYSFKLGFTFPEAAIDHSSVRMSPTYGRDPAERVWIFLNYNRYAPAAYEGIVLQGFGALLACSAFPNFTPAITAAPSQRYWWSSEYTDGSGVYLAFQSGVYRLDVAANLQPGEVNTNNCGNYPGSASALLSPDLFMKVTRRPHAPEGAWTPVTGAFKCLAIYADDGFDVTQYPLNPTIVSGSADDTPAFWADAYAQAVSDGNIPGGLVYGVDYPRAITNAWSGTTSSLGFPIALSEVVRPICARVGLEAADVDVIDLEDDYITGYTITRVMAAKDALDPLRQVGLFDIVEGLKLRFRQRGGPVVRRLSQSELGAAEGDADPGPAVKVMYADETSLPRIIRVHYKAPSRDYEDGEQISPARSTTTANNDLDVELAVSITDDLAAQLAEILWADAWESGISYEISLDQYHVDLEPGDVLELPMDGFYERTRVLEIDEAIPMLRQMKLARDYDGSFVSEAVADDPERTPGEMRVFGQSEAILLDIPPLRPEDNDAGIYFTTRPTDHDSTWRAAAVYRSVDGGVNYDAIGAVGTEPTTGTVTSALGDGQWFTWNDTQTLEVELVTGSLESRTEADVLGGANALAIGARGRWEIVQFTTVEQLTATTYRLSHLLRGRLGTEPIINTGQVGDMAVLISGAGIVRAPLTDADIDLSSLVRAVTSGLSFADATDQAFIDAGVALLPFAPVNIEAEVAADTTITWSRRDRLYQTLQGGVLPMSEDAEQYDVEVLVDGAIVESATVSVPEYIISPSLGGHFQVRVYQISAAVGRGSAGVLQT